MFVGDEMVVDLYKVRSNNNTLLIRVHMSDYSNVKSEFELKIPPLEELQILLPEQIKPRYASEIEPFIHLKWVNGASYTFMNV